MRLTRITTATGDDGDTGLADGSRLPKTSLRIRVMGEVDELNSLVGLTCAVDAAGPHRQRLLEIQHRLFDLGAELAMPGHAVLTAITVAGIERAIADINQALPPLREFVLPGGNPAAAQCHHARAVCRRAERELRRLAEQEPVNIHSLVYLNRLSDLLFVVAREIARRDGGAEITWNRET
jgi:cob(I)alamin adenosyltransferase